MKNLGLTAVVILLVLFLASQALAAVSVAEPGTSHFYKIYSDLKADLSAQEDSGRLRLLEGLKAALDDHLQANQQALIAVEQFLAQHPGDNTYLPAKQEIIRFRQTLQYEYLRHILLIGKPNSDAFVGQLSDSSPDPEKALFPKSTGGSDITIEIGAGDPHETVLE